MASKWFEVDHAGLAEIAKRRGMAFVMTEPIQNAWDEASETVEVTLAPVSRSPTADLVVKDDAPNGFQDLTDSHTLFRESRKLSDPEKRGRFNLGEKLLLAAAVSARVTSTTGSVIFGEKGRTTGRKKTERGSILEARLRMTRAEAQEALDLASRLIPPPGITTTINGKALPGRTPVATASRTLETEVRGEEGGFRYTRRKTEIEFYDPKPGESPSLYEMGIPIDTLDCPWHVNVLQKVPLSMDRGSVRWGYSQAVQRVAAEAMAKKLTEDQARDGWVSVALADMDDDEAVRAVVEKRFGGKAVTYDPSDHEANKRALDAGYHVVKGGELSKRAWQTVKRAGALEPAGRKFSTIQERSEDGQAPEPRRAWTPEMEAFSDYAIEFSAFILDKPLGVAFYRLRGNPAMAFCGGGEIGLNLCNGGAALLAERDQKAIDALLIHEVAHVKVSDHLSDAFHEECCRIGAALRDFCTEVTWPKVNSYASKGHAVADEEFLFQ